MYKKVNNNPDSLQHQKLGIESIYDVIKAFATSYEIFEDMKSLDYIWHDNFQACADRVDEIMKNDQQDEDTKLIKESFILLIKILTKVFKIIRKQQGFELVQIIRQRITRIIEYSLQNSKFHTQETKDLNLKLIFAIQKLEIYATEYLALYKNTHTEINSGSNSLEMYMEIAEHYYKIAFDAEMLNQFKQSFCMQPDSQSIEQDSYELARIIAQGIRFWKNIFEDPSFWSDEIIYSQNDPSTTAQIEERIKEFLYTTQSQDYNRLKMMCN